MRTPAAWPVAILVVLLFTSGCAQDAAARYVEVPLDIIEGAGDSTLALVPVMIGDAGPYSFALDTGASNSVVDASIADELDLAQVSDSAGVTGVAGRAQAVQVQVPQWRTGDVELGARRVLVLDLSAAGARTGIQGLIGSDVLSAFGTITVDYDAAVLRLRPHSESPHPDDGE